MAVPAEVDNAVLRHLPVIPAHPDTVHDRLHITAISKYIFKEERGVIRYDPGMVMLSCTTTKF